MHVSYNHRQSDTHRHGHGHGHGHRHIYITHPKARLTLVLELVGLLVSEEEHLLVDGAAEDLARRLGRELVHVLCVYIVYVHPHAVYACNVRSKEMYA